MTRPECTYCQRPAHLLQAVGKRPAWSCTPCNAICAVVPDSIRSGEFKPMGRFLKPDGVKLKKKALRAFKRYWSPMLPGLTRGQARDFAYKELAAAMGREKVHIEALDVDELKLVIEALRGMGESHGK